jgi:hypothetical protein
MKRLHLKPISFLQNGEICDWRKRLCICSRSCHSYLAISIRIKGSVWFVNRNLCMLEKSPYNVEYVWFGYVMALRNCEGIKHDGATNTIRM